MTDLERLAVRLDDAARTATAVRPITLDNDLTPDQAYEIQRRSVARRLGRGEALVGLKMGLTSRAKMRQVGVNEVIWGRLTDAMRLEDGGRVHRARSIHPRAEPEIAFLLRRPVTGPLSVAEAMAAVEAVAPAIEVIDSRYEDFKFTLPDVIADNASSSGFALGPWNRPDVDYANLGVVFERDGRPVQYGSTAAILGHPGRALAAASRLATRAGLTLEAGWVVMAGAATAATSLAPGCVVRATFEELGRVALAVVT